MSNTILYRVPSGVPGSITRPDNTVVESGFFNPTYPCTAFGQPVKMVSGLLRIPAANDAASVFFGILARVAPSIAGDTLQTMTSGTPNVASIQSVVKRGYVNVLCTVGTPVRSLPAYMRVVVNAPKAVGDWEATQDVTVAGGVITGTGTGTIAATVTAPVIAGTWSLVLQTTSQTSKVTVIDPNGVRHPDATVGTAYSSGGLNFTITAAGTMTALDSFAPVVTNNNVAIPGVQWASDGVDAGLNAEIVILGLQ